MSYKIVMHYKHYLIQRDDERFATIGKNTVIWNRIPDSASFFDSIEDCNEGIELINNLVEHKSSETKLDYLVYKLGDELALTNDDMEGVLKLAAFYAQDCCVDGELRDENNAYCAALVKKE